MANQRNERGGTNTVSSFMRFIEGPLTQHLCQGGGMTSGGPTNCPGIQTCGPGCPVVSIGPVTQCGGVQTCGGCPVSMGPVTQCGGVQTCGGCPVSMGPVTQCG